MSTPNRQREADEEFQELYLNNKVSSVGDTSDSSSTSNRKKREHSRNIKLEKYVQKHGIIIIVINEGETKPISKHSVRFSNAIGVAVRFAFPVHCRTFTEVPNEFIELAKIQLLAHFKLDLSSQRLNRFIEHQMQNSFKEFRADLNRHYRKCGNPQQVCASLPSWLKNRPEDWDFLCDRFKSEAFQEMSVTNSKNRAKYRSTT
ncbi:uncharacterized protein LOC120089695 [Benincasa hispida]|uniref:uncharacterized protein LOC120089695 n=1 Tax=Benincasa hispida TaxID=102211 RepID=UPI0018FF1943|nr:uncharacterized protein LOC120089695 [Benincasa hispida]